MLPPTESAADAIKGFVQESGLPEEAGLLNGKPEEVFYATGNGGNKIFVFKDQPLVIVVTATAFGQWYAHQQVGSMMDEYILPALSK